MALSEHLVELSEKHSFLERKLEEEMTRPVSDSLKVAELKRKKLLLKDKISKLRNTEDMAV